MGENASNVFLASLLIKTIKIFSCQLSAPFLSPKELAAFKIGNSFVDYVNSGHWTLSSGKCTDCCFLNIKSNYHNNHLWAVDNLYLYVLYVIFGGWSFPFWQQPELLIWTKRPKPNGDHNLRAYCVDESLTPVRICNSLTPILSSCFTRPCMFIDTWGFYHPVCLLGPVRLFRMLEYARADLQQFWPQCWVLASSLSRKLSDSNCCIIFCAVYKMEPQ